jgi:hypothetical protein
MISVPLCDSRTPKITSVFCGKISWMQLDPSSYGTPQEETPERAVSLHNCGVEAVA